MKPFPIQRHLLAAGLLLSLTGRGFGAEPKSEATPVQTGGPYFAMDIMPIIDRLGCSVAACHGAPTAKPHLSLFGGDARTDYAALQRAVAQDAAEPEKSALVRKLTGAVPHSGGKKIEPGSPDCQKLVAWLAHGAQWNDDKLPPLASIRIAPEAQMLSQGASRDLSVLAVYADKSEKDVTSDARFWSNDKAIADVNATGRVTATGFGETTVVATFLRHFAVARITIPQPLAQGFPATTANNRIDELVHAKLKQLGIPPSGLSTDQEFLRRVYLDVIGTLPTVDEARSFAADASPDKRTQLIDRLFARGEFADYWAMKWADLLCLKSESPISMWPNAVQAYHRWLKDSIAANKPYDQFVEELLLASGSNFADPPANYFRASMTLHYSNGLGNNDPLNPVGTGELTAAVLMGTRLACARCHVHPKESWTQDDNLGLAAVFAQLGVKGTKEWKEQVVCFNPNGKLKNPRTRQDMAPKLLDAETLTLQPGEDAREKLAAWLTDPKNPWLARNIVNRIWFWLLGRGIVHEADDIRSTNPPVNPELLAYLERELVGHGYDLRHIYRLILNSQTYQRSSLPTPLNAMDVTQFSHYPVKRLGAEQLLDAISQVTDNFERFNCMVPQPHAKFPEHFRAIQLADGSMTSSLLQLFGRPTRDQPFEGERDNVLSARQVLYLLNSAEVQEKIKKSVALLPGAIPTDSEFVQQVYLRSLSRLPTPGEEQAFASYAGKCGDDQNLARRDFVWAIFNSNEFLFNH